MNSILTLQADEVLSTSDRSRVVRRFGANSSLIWKEALEPGAAKRARHESAMLLRLAAVPGVAKLSTIAAAPGGINLKDSNQLSAIVMRLLEKEPDRRYQSAEGLAADLRLLRDRRARGEDRAFALATSDFPQRLLPPSRLIGRDAERSLSMMFGLRIDR